MKNADGIDAYSRWTPPPLRRGSLPLRSRGVQRENRLYTRRNKMEVQRQMKSNQQKKGIVGQKTLKPSKNTYTHCKPFALPSLHPPSISFTQKAAQVAIVATPAPLSQGFGNNYESLPSLLTTTLLTFTAAPLSRPPTGRPFHPQVSAGVT